MWQTTQALSHYRRLLSDPWEMTSLPNPRFPWPHHVPHHLCVNIKSSIFGKAAAEWLMLCLSARRRQGRQSKCEDGLVLVQWPPHTLAQIQRDLLQSFPWFLFWTTSVVSTVSQAPPKKWHILRPDASASLYKAVIISRALFSCPGQAIFNHRWKLEYPSCPLSTPPFVARYCSVLVQTGGVWRDWLPVRARDSTVSLLAVNATFTFSHCT